MNRLLLAVAALLMLLAANTSRADTFGSGANSFEIEFVTIGNPGNPADTTGEPNPAGSVPSTYRIGKYEISEDAVRKANTLSAAAGQPLSITLDTRGPNKPATNITWLEAAKFVNWLNASIGSVPAYKFSAGGNFQLWQPGDLGYNPSNLYRNSRAKYFLPSVHEWYKAAYFDPTNGTYFDYATSSNSSPLAVANGVVPGSAVYDQEQSVGPAEITLAGGLSPSGTMAQGGNVYEWEETEFDLTNDSFFGTHGRRGGAWYGPSSALSASTRGSSPLTVFSLSDTGFRVASIVPEPSAISSVGVGLIAILGLTSRLSSKRRCDDARTVPWLE